MKNRLALATVVAALLVPLAACSGSSSTSSTSTTASSGQQVTDTSCPFTGTVGQSSGGKAGTSSALSTITTSKQGCVDNIQLKMTGGVGAWTVAYATGPVTDGSGNNRDGVRRALTLLQQAGWQVRDRRLVNAQGQRFTLEFLDNSGSMGRVVTPYAKNLEKLGFKVNYKVIDFAVLQKRMDVFDFEIISNRIGGSEAPGTELLERFGSKAADTEGSSNVMGVKDPAVDALLDKVVAAQTRPQLVAALKALDRVLRHGHYAVPHWYGSVHRVSWRAGRFEQPEITPRYYQPEIWVTSTWWASTANLVGHE